MNSRRVFLILALISIQANSEQVQLQMPNQVRNGAARECELTSEDKPKNVKVTLPNLNSTGRMILGGGGWQTDIYTKPFVSWVIKNIPEGDEVPVILSAAKDASGAAAGYAHWQRDLFQGKVRVAPIFTTAGGHQSITLQDMGPGANIKKFEEEKEDPNGSKSSLTITNVKSPDGAVVPPRIISTDPNAETNLQAIRNARTAIVIDGGMLGALDHIGGTKLGTELQKAYDRGVTIYASSEGTNAIGRVNLSLMWPKLGQRTPLAKAGLGVTNDFGVSSHIRDPRLISVLGFGKSTDMSFADRNKTIFEATNPYAFMSPMRELQEKGIDFPMFGVPERSVMAYRQGIAEFRGESPESRFYVFDPRYPVNAMCDYYYVKDNSLFDLNTGKVIPRAIQVSSNSHSPLDDIASYFGGTGH